MTRLGKIRYYQGRAAYPQSEQISEATAQWDLNLSRRDVLTTDVDCTHMIRLVSRGTTAEEARLNDEQMMRRYRDETMFVNGFRVLTHKTLRGSTGGSSYSTTHDIVYVVESRPTRGYVKLTLRRPYGGATR